MNYGNILASIRAVSSSHDVSSNDIVTLLLLPELIVVVDCKEMMQQQAFAISEIDCQKIDENGSVHIRILLSHMTSLSNSMVSTLHWSQIHTINFSLLHHWTPSLHFDVTVLSGSTQCCLHWNFTAWNECSYAACSCKYKSSWVFDCAALTQMIFNCFVSCSSHFISSHYQTESTATLRAWLCCIPNWKLHHFPFNLHTQM